jgi:hypothetical protein
VDRAWPLAFDHDRPGPGLPALIDRGGLARRRDHAVITEEEAPVPAFGSVVGFVVVGFVLVRTPPATL